jgi:WD40 repeat protein
MSSPLGLPRRIGHTAPITSLSFLGSSYLLASETSVVNVFSSASPSPLLHQHRLFHRDRIHGIVLNETHVLFWGGRSLAILPITDVVNAAELQVKEILAPDWILSAAFLPSGDVVVVGAHNEVLVYKDGKWTTTSCGVTERTMLYSADLRVGAKSEVTVAAGTVFGEIVIWELHPGNQKGRITKRFRGHEGSVFAVRFHPEGRWVASCSDDRTLRVWDLEATTEDDKERGTTGFEEVEGEAKGGKGCVAMGWGHQARPWGVRFLPAEEGDGDGVDFVKLASVAEDLTARFWRFKTGGGKGTQMMENTNTYMMHQGKNVWGFAFDFERKLMATGGADGRVAVVDYAEDVEKREEWDLGVIAPLPEEEAVPEPVPEPTPADDAEVKDAKPKKKPKKVKKKLDAFKNYAVLDKERFVVTTVFGRLLLHNITENSWRTIGTLNSLSKWSVVGAWEDSGIVALGDLEGNLGIIDIDNNREWWWNAAGRGKVADVLIQGKKGSEFFKRNPQLCQLTYESYLPIDNFQVITTSVSYETSVLHSFTLQPTGPPLRKTTLLNLPSSKFTVTSALVTEAQLFLGSRTGDLAIYSPPPSSTSDATIDPISYHPTLYSPDALTSLLLSPSGTLLTTSFNGLHTTHSLPSLEATHISKPGNITNITGQSFGHQGDLNIFGFRGTRFIVHNLSTSTDVLSIDCGGGHRAWSYSPLHSWFLWTQAVRAQSCRVLRPRTAILKHGSHGREIKTISFCPKTGLIATGAEDTVIRISFVDAEGRVKEERAVQIKRHTTGVQCLQWSEDGERLVSSGGVDELFVFRVRVQGGQIGVTEEAVLPVEGKDEEVRICGVDVVRRDGGYLVAGAMSDGWVKVWSYEPAKGWGLVNKTMYAERCMMHVKFLELEKELGLMTAATDGVVVVYTGLEGSMEQVWKQTVHQSSVKALSAEVEWGRVKVYTGGDDCAIAVTEVDTKEWKTIRCDVVPRAHASAVTEVLRVGEKLVSVGLDQRIRIWGGQLKRVAMEDSIVPDISGAVMVRSDVVVVAGVGIESWKLE